jgi:outer membrane immunogenic protein
MRRLAVVLIAAVSAIAFIQSASAADMPAKAPVVKAPVAIAPTWTGFYLGIAGGYGWGSTQHTNEFNGINSGTDNNLRGGIFGGTYGYNWQSGPLVLGFEGDISWSGIKDTFTDNNNSGFCSPATSSCVTDLKWLGTDRARIGYAWDRWLVYATGGVAYGSVNAYIQNASQTNETHTRTGSVLGGGVEAMLAPNWSAKLEYLYVNLGDKTNYHFAPSSGIGEKVLVRSSIVRLGVNYHFGGL